MTQKAEKLLLALRARGVDSTDLRHSVHEAVHAFDAKLPEGEWSNERVAAAMKRIGPGRAARSEVMARAVEQLVCKRVGIEIRPIEHWAGISVMEAIKFGDPFLTFRQAEEAMKNAMESLEAKLIADRICGLRPPRKRTQPTSSGVQVGALVRSKYTNAVLRVVKVSERFIYVNKVEGKPWKSNSRMRHEDVTPEVAR